MSALALERFPQPMEITVVRSLGIPVIGVGESTTASLPAFLHGVLQLDRQSFYARVQPSWKLGIRFLWGSRNAPYFYYPFDSRLDAVHPEMQLAEAYHCYNDMRDNTPYTCLMERSRAPFYNRHGRVVLDEGFGYHLDNVAFLEYLESVARQRYITFVEAEISSVERYVV